MFAESPLTLLESLALRRYISVQATDRKLYGGIVRAISADGTPNYYNVTFHTGQTVCVHLPL